MGTLNRLEFVVGVQDDSNRDTLEVKIATENQHVVAFIIRDTQTLEQRAVLHLSGEACNLIGQALMLASTAKAGDE